MTVASRVLVTPNRRVVSGPLNRTKAVKPTKGGKYVIVRTLHAGVFAGEIISRKGTEAVMRNARRLWRWSGSASLSQMAMEGTSNPGGCKFPVAVDRVELLGVIEILDATEAARRSIEGVPVWRA